MSRWFLLQEEKPLPAAVNMARDEFLFEWCRNRDVGILRIYAWEQASFSIGVSQKVNRAVNLDLVREEGHPLVRRVTGGKTVLHDDELTYAVISSEDIFHRKNDLLQSYRLIAGILVEMFLKVDIPAELSTQRNATLARSNHPCFSFPTPNEIEIKGLKIVGSAQKRNTSALLQHGSIPFSMNYELYARATRMRADRIREHMTTVRDISPSVTREDLSRALVSAFQDFTGQPFEEYDIGSQDQQVIQDLVGKYDSMDWNLSH